MRESSKNSINISAFKDVLSSKRIDELIINANTTIEQIQKDLLLVQRSSSILPLVTLSLYPSYVCPSRDDISKHIISPNVLPPQDATPTFIQQTSILFSYLQSNPDFFAKAVVGRSKKSDFMFLLHSVIPSVYGFFSSLEHVELALLFYSHIIRITKPQMAMKILQPILCSIGSSRFIECVMQKFLVKFGSEKRFDSQTKDKKLIDSFAVLLSKFIFLFLPLIPSQFLVLIHIASSHGWTGNDVYELLQKCFLGPLFSLWFKSTPFASRITVFQSIMDSLFSNTVFSKGLVSSILTVESSFDLPELFRPFKHKYLLFFVTVADIICIHKSIKSFKEMPVSFEDIRFDYFHQEIRFRPFYVRVFPKGISQTVIPYRPLLFSKQGSDTIQNSDFERAYREIDYQIDRKLSVYEIVSIDDSKYDEEFKDYCLKKSLDDVYQRSEAFEQLIISQMYLSILKEWRDLIYETQNAFFLPIAIKAAKAISTIMHAHLAFQKSSKKFKNISIKRIQYLVIIEPVFLKMIEENMQDFEKLTTGYSCILKKSVDTINIFFINECKTSVQYIFWEVVEEMRSIPNISYVWKFEILISVLSKLHKIAKDKKEYLQMVEVAVAFANIDVLPQLFLLFNKLLVQNTTFAPMISDTELYIWTSLETILLTTTNQDLGIQRLFLSISAAIKN